MDIKAIIIAAVIGFVITCCGGAIVWLVKRYLSDLDSKFVAVNERIGRAENKAITTGQHHFTKEESLNVRVAVLEERTKNQ